MSSVLNPFIARNVGNDLQGVVVDQVRRLRQRQQAEENPANDGHHITLPPRQDNAGDDHVQQHDHGQGVFDAP